MHHLLKKQLKEHLPDHLQNDKNLKVLWNVIENTYTNYEEEIERLQKCNEPFLNQNYSVEELSRITSEKNRLLKNLEQRNEALNNYAHMVSHDLKSPIRNVYSLVSWVFEDSDAKFKQDCQENIELIYKNLDRMDKLIDGILKHTTIDNLEDSNEEVDLNSLVKAIIFKYYLTNNVKVKVRNKLPTVVSNKYRMEQLFDNLLSNAIKAVEASTMGMVEIDFKEKTESLLFSVSDNGIGIPKHQQETIFDMFKKLTDDASATGIGLALVKKIINYYKGDIWISSEENKGTSVFFTLNKK